MAKGKEFKRPYLKSTNRFSVQEEPPKINYLHNKPVFSFYHMQYRKPNCISQCEHSEKSGITDRLIELSQLTWNTIVSAPRTGFGFEKMPQSRFKVPLPSIVTPEVTIEVFRYSDGGRIAGFRERDIYHILVVGNDLYDH